MLLISEILKKAMIREPVLQRLVAVRVPVHWLKLAVHVHVLWVFFTFIKIKQLARTTLFSHGTRFCTPYI